MKIFNFVYITFVKLNWIITYLILWPIIRLVYHVTVTANPEIYRATKPLVLISNHRSIFDPWIVCINLPFTVFCRLLPIRIMGARDFLYPIARWLKRLLFIPIIYFMYGVLSIKKSWSFEQKIEPHIKALRKKETIMLFPEGSINVNPGVKDFRRGAASILSVANAPILPISINFHPVPNSRTECILNYGEPVTIPQNLLTDKHSPEYADATKTLKNLILALQTKII